MDEGLSEVLTLADVVLGCEAKSMDEAVEFVGQMLVERGAVNEAYVAGMHIRETKVSTYLGNGVSLPHGTFETRDEVITTQLVVAQYPAGVDWEAGTAHLVVGLAATGEDHVAVLGQLAEVLQDEGLCERLWVTEDAQFLFETLTTITEDDDEDDD